ncbi:unnamed protein product [Candidula unifasciata]|uniref:TIR domain-containing protein n=1 Tax=Candidula unifasciata TaxID=100452 RepID=A0A8S3ZSX3_9EUPU|nr:unnamed protein product [Candidula unifasciata]
MAVVISACDLMLLLLALLVVMTLSRHDVKAATFVSTPYNTTVDSNLDFICPIECMCYKTNETSGASGLWINCTVDYFSSHLTTLLNMVSSPLTGYAFFTCTRTATTGYDEPPPESFIWEGAFQTLGQLKALVFDHCKFRKISKNGFRGLGSLTQLIIRDAIISDLDPGLLTYLPQLDTLEISNSLLTHLFPVCTAGHLRVLNISRNNFLSLENAGLNCPDGSASLETLDINSNLLTEIPDWLDQSLPHLHHLGIADNYISKTEESPFQNLQKLTFLDISINSLTSISSKFFKGCPNLLILGLAGNRLSTLPRSLLANLSVLQQFEIGEMNLNDDVWMELAELRQLVHLNMSGNELTSVNTDVMSQFLRLQYCYLDHNKINLLPKTAFEYQLNLNTLDLSFNEIPEIPLGAFRKQHVLKHLFVHHNQITSVGYEAFHQLKDLITFDFSYNKITSLPPKVFYELANVTYFDLSSNNLSQIDNDLFSRTLHITHLNLSHNSLVEMTPVNQLLHLFTLDVSHNKISILNQAFLLDLHHLVTFNISHNELKTLPVKLFKGCENLRIIDLSYNSIKLLDEATFYNAAHVQTIILSDNDLTDLGTVFSGLKDLETLDLSFNSITKILRGQIPHMIKTIDLSHNKITLISAHTFKSLSRIRTVDLSGNRLTSLNRMDVEIAFNLGYIPVFKIQFNPFVCDCKLGWLKDWSSGMLKDMMTLPDFVLGFGLDCSSPFYGDRQNLQQLPRSEFLCPYSSHCEESCMCCDYACYCKYVCPAACQCYIGDDFWHVHHVLCNSANLTAVPAGLPEGATDLRLDGNNIPVLPKHAFLALKLVGNLYLNHSQIQAIENNTFRGLKSVKRLFLNDNHLTVIYSVTFQGLESLEEVYLNNNDIHTFDVQALFAPATLNLINLQNNALLTISLTDLFNFTNRSLDNSAKTKLYLSGNHWSCDLDFACRFLSFVQKNSEFIGDVSFIECIPPVDSEQSFYTHRQSLMLTDLQPELCIHNQTIYENITRHSTEAPAAASEIYALIAACIIIVFALALLIVAYTNRHFLQVVCFTRFGLRVFKMAKASDDNERPYDAFISYSNKDEDFVIRQLAPRLENGDKKFKLCVHYRDFPVGACIAETIVRSVEASKRTILVVSDNFLDSEWCRFEFQTAHQQVLNERRNRVILILLHDLDSDKLDSTLKVYMRTRTYLKYDDPWFWEKLLFAMPDIRQRKPKLQAGGNDHRHLDKLTIDSRFSGNPEYQSTRNVSSGETIHNDLYEIPVLESPNGHYQLANSISCSTHTNSAYHNSDISDGTTSYHNGSVNGSCCHYEEVGPGCSSNQSTPQKQIGTPPPVPSIPKEGFVPRQKLLTLKV